MPVVAISFMYVLVSYHQKYKNMSCKICKVERTHLKYSPKICILLQNNFYIINNK